MRSLITFTLFTVSILIVISSLPATPIQDANLVMWLDGNDIDGDGVAEGAGENYIIGGTATWADKSPAAPDNTATQGTVANQPAMTVASLNGSNYLAFDGSDVLNFSSVDIVGGTAFVVARHGNTGLGQLLGGASGNRQFRYQANATTVEITGAPSLGLPQVTGVTSVFAIVGAEATSSTSRLALNGSFGATKGHSETTFTYGHVGARNGLIEALTGDVAEVIAYDRNLNSAERIVTENYLNAKYNIDSDGSSPIANDRYSGDLSANGDYDSDVFGIGQVDSSNTLTFTSSAGFGLEAISGGVGPDSDLNDGEFVLAGHKTSINGLTSAGVASGEQRWQRVWSLDTNGGNVDATLSFDWSDSGIVEPFDASFGTLYYSPTDPYSFTAIAGASSVVGDQVFFDITSLQPGFYTLGTQVPEPSSLLLLGLGVLGLVRRPRRRRRNV